jgi:hypothetical protein
VVGKSNFGCEALESPDVVFFGHDFFEFLTTPPILLKFSSLLGSDVLQVGCTKVCRNFLEKLANVVIRSV